MATSVEGRTAVPTIVHHVALVELSEGLQDLPQDAFDLQRGHVALSEAKEVCVEILKDEDPACRHTVDRLPHVSAVLHALVDALPDGVVLRDLLHDVLRVAVAVRIWHSSVRPSGAMELDREDKPGEVDTPERHVLVLQDLLDGVPATREPLNLLPYIIVALLVGGRSRVIGA